MNIDQTNKDYEIRDQLKIVAGNGGFPMIEVDTGTARALISIYAGQILSYRPTEQAEDLLFLSKSAYYAPGKAIKGGIPICWPWFGPDPEGKGRPGHGCVRNRIWKLLATEMLADGRIQVRLGLSDNDETREIWPGAFELELWNTIGDTLNIALITRNKGTEGFTLSQGLHTYFRVGDIGKVQVQGLDGKIYIDKLDADAEKQQQGMVNIDDEVDRIYTGVDGALEIQDQGLGRTIRIASTGSASAVVWNPWADTAAAMADLGDEDYRTMLCVETTNAGPDVVSVEAGGEYKISAEYRLVNP